MSDVISPITKSTNVSFVADLETRIIIQKYKDELSLDVSSYFQGLDKIRIFKCNETGFRFYYPPSLAGDENFYEELQEKVSYYPEWKWENEVALKYIRKVDRVLEVGCGSGMFLERLRNENIDAVGLEFNSRAILECEYKGLKVYKSDIEEYSAEFTEKFDVVCHFQVFEHVVDPQKFLEACLRALKPNGRLIVGVPNNNPYLYKRDIYHTLNLPPHHIGLWNKDSLKRLAEFNRLDIETIKTEPLFDLNYYFAINFPFLRRSAKYLQRLKFLEYLFEGRNVIAVLIKR